MPAALQIVRFGSFSLDLRSAELHRNGTTTQLAEQPFQVLTALLERPGEVVTRDELRQRLWGAETFVDFEHGLNTAVKRLREVLGDSAENPRYIETLPRHGYRFIAPVDGTTKTDFATRTPAEILPYLVTAGLACLLVLIAVTSYLVWHPKNRTDGLEKRITLAVLPFENVSGDPSQEFFSEGVTEELINWLGRVDAQHLGVIAATSAMKYKHSTKKITEIGRELGVNYIVEGTVLQGEGRTRITVQLIRVEDQTHLWAESYERDTRDILVMQTDIARAVAQQIRLTLTPEAQQQFSRARRVDPEAYLDFLRGQVESTSFTFEGMAREQAYYERALRKDPNFALAYAGLGNCYLSYMITLRMPPGEAAKRTKEFVTKALQLDENLGEAYGVLAYTNWRYDWDVQAADRNFQRAFELSPNSRLVHSHHINYIAWRGQKAEALAEWALVRQLDPVRLESAVHSGHVYYQLRDYRPMLEAMRSYVASNPHHWLGRNLLGVAYQGLGQTLLAIPEYQKAVEYSGNDSDPVAALAYTYARSGKRAEASETVRELLEQSKTSYVSPYMISTIYAGLGNKDKAFEFLAKAYDERSTDLSYFLKSDLRMDTLRSDPRFQSLLDRIGLPQ